MRVLVRAHLTWLWRAKDVLSAVLLTLLTVGLVGALALHEAEERALAATAILYLSTTIAALVAAARTLHAEHGTGGLRGLLLAPIDRRDLFLARTLASLPLVLALAGVTWLGLVPLFPELGPLTTWRVLPALLVAVVGLAVLGQVAAWASLASGSGELLGPGLALPLSAPLLIGCLHATETVLLTGQVWTPSLTFAAGYALAVAALSYLVAGALVEVA